MANVIKKVTINEMESWDGIVYNVRLWKSIDGGNNFYYAGYGKFFESLAEAEEYKRTLLN